MTQLGNEGGQPYWSWYGFEGRVEWCACFVSWCADQCGYIESGIIPKFAGCVDGANWFKGNGQWQDRNYEPQAGNIIFFDWEGDGETDHVGIVENAKTVLFTPWRVILAMLADKINIRLEAAPSMVTVFLPIKNGQKEKPEVYSSGSFALHSPPTVCFNYGQLFIV